MGAVKNYDFSVLDLSRLDELFELESTAETYNNITYEEWKDIFEWRVIKNPFRNNKVPGYMVKHGDRIVANWDHVYVPFMLGNWKGVVPNPASYVHPDYSKQKGYIWLLMSEKILKNSNFEVTITTHSQKFVETLWKRYGALEMAYTNINFQGILSLKKMIDMYASKKNRLIGVLSKAGLHSLISPFVQMKGYKEISSPPVRSEIISPFDLKSASDNMLDELCDEALSVYNIGIMRSAAYLRWRYSDNPLSRQYHTLMIRNSEQRVVGLSILRFLEDTSHVSIYEFIYNPNISDSSRELINAVVKVARSLGGMTISSRIITKDIAKEFLELGMVEKVKSHHQALFLTNSTVFLPEESDVLFTFGDSNIFSNI